MAYGKVWDTMFDGSLVMAGWEGVVTFMVMIVLADKDGFVDMTPLAISNRTTIPLEVIEKGVAQLEAEDPHSRDSDHAGRRIERLDDHRDWGWAILNYEKYRNARDDAALKAHWREQYKKRKARQQKAKRKSA